MPAYYKSNYSWLYFLMCMYAELLQLCPTLCDLTNNSLSDSSVHGILQARILEWVAVPFSEDLPNPGIELVSLMSPALAGGYLTTSATWATLHSGTRGQSYQPPASDEKERNTQACKRLSSSRLQKRSICSLSGRKSVLKEMTLYLDLLST